MPEIKWIKDPLLQARRKDRAAEEKRHRQERHDSLIRKLGSLEEKAALLMEGRAKEAEAGRLKKLKEIKEHQDAITSRRCEFF